MASIGSLVERIKALPPVRAVLRVQSRYGEEAGGVLANGLAFQAFISLFPLLLLGLSVIGFVLADRPDLAERWNEAVRDGVPGLSALVGENLDVVTRSRAGTGLIGLAGLAWTGTGLVRVGRAIVLNILGIDDPANPLSGPARAIASFAVLSLAAAVALGVGVWAGNTPASGWTGTVLRAGAFVVSAVVNVAFFTLVYGVLTRPRAPGWATLARGGVFMGFIWTVLTVVGSVYARRTVGNATAVYGTFAASLGLLVVLSIAARAYVYGAVIVALRRDAVHHDPSPDPVAGVGDGE